MVSRLRHRLASKCPWLAVRCHSILPRLRRLTLILLSISILGSATLFLSSGHLVIAGIPASVLLTFLHDRPALSAFLRGDKQGLHDRLSAIGVEEAIKDHYRSSIPDEAELDRHIHQLFYELTGYVGQDYRVNDQGQLVLRSTGSPRS